MAFHRKAVLWLFILSVAAVQVGCKHKIQGLDGGGGHQGAYNFVAGVCSLHYSGNCVAATPGSPTNICSGTNCNIGLAINTSTNGVTLTLNGVALASTNPDGIVCVPKNTTNAIQWSTDSGNNFIVDFGNAAAIPTSANTAVSYLASPDGSTINSNSPNLDVCYKYNVKVCQNATSPTPTGSKVTCGEWDPKIIIGTP